MEDSLARDARQSRCDGGDANPAQRDDVSRRQIKGSPWQGGPCRRHRLHASSFYILAQDMSKGKVLTHGTDQPVLEAGTIHAVYTVECSSFAIISGEFDGGVRLVGAFGTVVCAFAPVS